MKKLIIKFPPPPRLLFIENYGKIEILKIIRRERVGAGNVFLYNIIHILITFSQNGE